MKTVPTFSSLTPCPLTGALHLPRLWLKLSLEDADQLAEGYPGMGPGYDAMTCAALGLDPEEVKGFVATLRPTYPQFVKWVQDHAKTQLTKDALYRHNIAITAYCHDEKTRQSILAANGLPDNGSVNPGAGDLNILDDLLEVHTSLNPTPVKRAECTDAISSRVRPVTPNKVKPAVDEQQDQLEPAGKHGDC
ncbi:MAG: DUF5069 domain-containing protein [Patescibacteria group bacterium]